MATSQLHVRVVVCSTVSPSHTIFNETRTTLIALHTNIYFYTSIVEIRAMTFGMFIQVVRNTVFMSRDAILEKPLSLLFIIVYDTSVSRDGKKKAIKSQSGAK